MELTGNLDIVTGLNATRVGADAVSEKRVGKCLYRRTGDSFALRRIAEVGNVLLGGGGFDLYESMSAHVSSRDAQPPRQTRAHVHIP